MADHASSLTVKGQLFLSKNYYSYLHKQPSKVGNFSQRRKGRVVTKFYPEISQI
jgi:hypothetical protein